ncbi:MAG: helix-turn-helix domain-containing protein [Chloroflexi bacterium]|nr:helix-turn-helix domain-containing protein [Chloroflexota bacterium]
MTEADTFGKLLRQLRLAADVSREALAERSGLSAKAIGALERGERSQPRKATVELLAQALDVGPSERAALVAAARPATRPRPLAEPPASARLRVPIPPTPLIGREADLAHARARLAPDAAEVRLLTLIGPGGVGKTRLALEIAAHAGPGYRDGAVFIDLAPVHDARLVAATIARALEVRESGGHSAQDLLRLHLAERQLLLVLDNFEHLLEAAPLVADLLAGCVGLKVLATSRSALRLRAEHRMVVAPLAVAETTQPLEAIAAAPAVQLFVQRAQAVRSDFALTATNAADVARICRRLDGLPLAIELAAVHADVLQPGALLRRLEHRLAGLPSGAADLPERQRTLRTTLTWSYDLLEPAAQALLARLSVFLGGCTVEAAQAVWALDGPADVLDPLSWLIGNSLVRHDGDPEPRVRLLETIREYAAEQLSQRGEQEAVRARHAEYFLIWAEAGAGRAEGPDAAAWFDALEPECENLHAALDWLAEHGAALDALRLAHAIAPFWIQRGPVHEARTRLTRLLEVPGSDGTSVRAAALLDAALLAWAQADYAAEQQLAEAAVAAFGAAGDASGSAQALADLAAANCNAGAYALARELAQRVLATQPDQHRRPYWRALMVLANSARDEADFGTAARYYHQVLARAQRAGDGEWVGHALGCLGWMAFYAGDTQDARAWHGQALEVRRARGQRREIAVSLTGLAHVALASRDANHARALYAQSLAVHREVGNQWGLAMVLEGCAATAASTAPALALRLASVAATLRSLIRRPMPIAEWPIHQGWLEPARRALDPCAAAAAWADGAAMPLDAALADAVDALTGPA